MTSQILRPTAYIKTLWWVESEDVSLTWSATLFNIKSEFVNMQILVDCGMFQWWKKDYEYNKKIDKKILNSDAIIITHAHNDHWGLLPVIVKNGYDKPIYMTELTARQLKENLLNSAKIMQQNLDKDINNNKKISEKYEYYLYLLKNIPRFFSSKENSENKKKLRNTLENKILKYRKKTNKDWSNTSGNIDLKKEFENAKNILKKNWIETKEDISKNLQTCQEIFFTKEDVEKTMSLVKFLEVWDKEILIDIDYIKYVDDKTLDYILTKIKNWHENDINVDTEVYNKLEEKLRKKTEENRELIEENREIEKENEKLEKELEKAFIIVEENKNLFKDKKKYGDFLEKVWFLDKEKLLKEYNIEELSDIKGVLRAKNIIDYDLKILQKTKDKLKPYRISNDDKFKKALHKLAIKFYNAGHIEWSVQILISATIEKVDSIIDYANWWKYKKSSYDRNFLFSWDLWRKNNPEPLIWKVEIAEEELNFLQIEGTNTWKRNINFREKAIEELFDVIKNAKQKVIIPTFSIQRTQSLLMYMMEKLKEEKYIVEEEKENQKEINKLKKSWENNEKLKLLEIKKKELRKNISFRNIFLDWSLAKQINEIYKKYLWEKYDLLKDEVQEKIFWKKIIKYIRTREDREKLYKDRNKFNRDIIIASSGMCEWWTILSHLKNNLGDEKSTICFTWYTPPNSRWWYIKQKKPVLIDWNLYEVKAKIVDINWFSGHISHNEILDYISEIKFATWANIYLNHWWEWRKQLKDDLFYLAKKWIKTELAELWKEIKIKL